MAAPISMSDSERQLIEAESQGPTGPGPPKTGEHDARRDPQMLLDFLPPLLQALCELTREAEIE